MVWMIFRGKIHRKSFPKSNRSISSWLAPKFALANVKKRSNKKRIFLYMRRVMTHYENDSSRHHESFVRAEAGNESLTNLKVSQFQSGSKIGHILEFINNNEYIHIWRISKRANERTLFAFNLRNSDQHESSSVLSSMKKSKNFSFVKNHHITNCQGEK